MVMQRKNILVALFFQIDLLLFSVVRIVHNLSAENTEKGVIIDLITAKFANHFFLSQSLF